MVKLWNAQGFEREFKREAFKLRARHVGQASNGAFVYTIDGERWFSWENPFDK